MITYYVKICNEKGIEGIGIAVQWHENLIQSLYLNAVKVINEFKYRFRRKLRKRYLNDGNNPSEKQNILVLMEEWDDHEGFEPPTTKIFTEEDHEFTAIVERRDKKFKVIASNNEFLWKAGSSVEVEKIKAFDLS